MSMNWIYSLQISELSDIQTGRGRKGESMRLIDANELMEHAGRDKLDSRELIMQMIENAPTVTAVEAGFVSKEAVGAIEKAYKEAETNLLHDNEYQRQLNQQILGRLNAYENVFEKIIRVLIETRS